MKITLIKSLQTSWYFLYNSEIKRKSVAGVGTAYPRPKKNYDSRKCTWEPYWFGFSMAEGVVYKQCMLEGVTDVTDNTIMTC